MKQTISLKQAIRNNLMILGMLIILSYIGLITLAYSFGLEKVVAIARHVEGMVTERQLLQNPEMPLPRNEMQSIYRHWEDVPNYWREPFEDIAFSDRQLYEANVTIDGQPQWVSMNYHVMKNGEALFIFSRMTESELHYLISGIAEVGLNYLLMGIALMLLSLLGVIIVLAKRITSPVLALNTWAANLGYELHPQPRQFNFIELNQLADNLLGAITRSSELADREHAFLKHVSHELRTPLAVMQASLDTLYEHETEQHKQASRPLSRALRACINMRHLAHTLLWLARESQTPLAKEQCALQELVDEQVQAHQYLLRDKKVTLTLNGTPDRQQIEIELLRIVTANLIRNAFQYTEQGKVEVTVDQGFISIRNPCRSNETVDLEEPGFGLGLQLVKRICDRARWEFQCSQDDNIFQVLVRWS